MVGRYLVFGCDTYYPIGGWGDFMFMTNDLAEAYKQANLVAATKDVVQLIDLEMCVDLLEKEEEGDHD